MKQFYLITLLLVISALTSVAQSFQGGLAGGLVGSQVAGDTYWGYHKLGAYAGGWIKLAVNDRSSFQTELAYIQKGSSHNPDTLRQNFTIYRMRLGYIEMPFLYQYHLKNKAFVEVGASFALLLHSYEAMDYMEISYGKFTLINPSFVAGIGYPITEKLGVHFRMDSSILSIRTDAISGARYRLFDHGQYNDCLLLFLSYKL